MDMRYAIDAQFDRAVAIVQSLPKAGPINTDYAEKLQMYSLYKQATVGNVKSTRPGLFDMLGRAKWDSWAKHKDISADDAKLMYVEALMKVLSKHSGQTVARDLRRELQMYNEDPTSRVLSRSGNSDSSGSTASRERAFTSRHSLQPQQQQQQQPQQEDTDSTSDEEDTDEDEARDLPHSMIPQQQQQYSAQALIDMYTRPLSSMSSGRYRTPTAALSPQPMDMHVPAVQPHPGFETPSAFAEPYSANANSFVAQSATSPPPPPGGWQMDQRQSYRSPAVYGMAPHIPASYASLPGRPESRSGLERAVVNVQAHLAALNERLERVETQRSNSSLSSSLPRRNSGNNIREEGAQWDLDDLGMWSFVLNPVSRGIAALGRLANLFSQNGNRSPVLVVVRRLCLDISFLVCVLATLRTIWRRSGMRRQEVNHALVVLWRAVIGTKMERPRVVGGV